MGIDCKLLRVELLSSILAAVGGEDLRGTGRSAMFVDVDSMNVPRTDESGCVDICSYDKLQDVDG